MRRRPPPIATVAASIIVLTLLGAALVFAYTVAVLGALRVFGIV